MINLSQIEYNNDRSLYLSVDKIGLHDYIKQARQDNLTHAVRVDGNLFPSIASAVDKVKMRLNLKQNVETFIRSDPNIQAACFAGDENTITISLTSGLVQIYDEDELCFVIGHEIGHHLYEHYRLPRIIESASRIEELNILLLKRSAEITADRIGCLSSNLDASLMAIVKLASGLPSSFIKKNFSVYLNQARELQDDVSNVQTLLSSHPSCPSRLRAILWFSMSDLYYDLMKINKDAPFKIKKVNKKISQDLSVLVNNKLDKVNSVELDNALKWGVIYIFSSDGTLSKREQNFLKNILPEQDIASTLEVLRSKGPIAAKTAFESSINNLKYADSKIREKLFSDLVHFGEISDGCSEAVSSIIEYSKKTLSVK